MCEYGGGGHSMGVGLRRIDERGFKSRCGGGWTMGVFGRRLMAGGDCRSSKFQDSEPPFTT